VVSSYLHRKSRLRERVRENLIMGWGWLLGVVDGRNGAANGVPWVDGVLPWEYTRGAGSVS